MKKIIHTPLPQAEMAVTGESSNRDQQYCLNTGEQFGSKIYTGELA